MTVPYVGDLNIPKIGPFIQNKGQMVPGIYNIAQMLYVIMFKKIVISDHDPLSIESCGANCPALADMDIEFLYVCIKSSVFFAQELHVCT